MHFCIILVSEKRMLSSTRGMFSRENCMFCTAKSCYMFWQECYVIWGGAAIFFAMYFAAFSFLMFAACSFLHEVLYFMRCVRILFRFFNFMFACKQTFPREAACQEAHFLVKQSCALWNGTACWKACSCQLCVSSRENAPLAILCSNLQCSHFFRLAEMTQSWTVFVEAESSPSTREKVKMDAFPEEVIQNGFFP